MSPQMVRDICKIDVAGQNLLKKAMEKLGLSARAYDRILKVSRTIADLAGAKKLNWSIWRRQYISGVWIGKAGRGSFETQSRCIVVRS